MSSAGVSALTLPRLLTTVLCSERLLQARTAVALLASRAFGTLGLMEPSLVRAALPGCVASPVKLLCTPAGQRHVVSAAQLCARRLHGFTLPVHAVLACIRSYVAQETLSRVHLS